MKTNDDADSIYGMNLARGECQKCGMFDINTDDGGEIVYVRYSKMPIYITNCPNCGDTTASKLNRGTAKLFDDLGVKSRGHDEELSEEEIDRFVDNFQEEIEVLLS